MKRTGILLALMLWGVPAALSWAQAPAPLSRFVPRDDLILYVEHDGLDRHQADWEQTAAYRMLTQTSLGVMLRETASQVLDRLIVEQLGVDRPVEGREVVGLVEHLARRGFVVAVGGELRAGGPGTLPEVAVLVVRDARTNPVFAKILGMLPPLNEPNARKVARAGGRMATLSRALSVEWWYEGDDFVISSARPDRDPAIEALTGVIPNAETNLTRIELAKPVRGVTPIALAFLDVKRLPPLPPQARSLGLDGLRRVDFQFGLDGEALVTFLSLQAPKPRRGLLALMDQPALDPNTLPPIPVGLESFTAFSLDLAAFYDEMLDLLSNAEPRGAQAVEAFERRLGQRLGVDLRDDVLAKLGPRMAFYILPSKSSGGGGGMLDFWLHIPRAVLVAEIQDRAAFTETLDTLTASANRELAALGGLFVPETTGRPLPATLAAAAFRKLDGPNPGYVLMVPPAVAPTPAALRPTLMLGRSHLAIAVSPDVATEALAATGKAPQVRGLRELPKGLVLLSQQKVSDDLPETLANLPALVQFLGGAMTSRPGQGPVNTFGLLLDPATIPMPDALRPYLFPRTTTATVDDQGLRIMTREAFPGGGLNPSVGASTPVMIALLLPAVQAAREAARRAQCTNNEKQLALAIWNYESAINHLPEDIKDADGKPLLSWRVAILPYIEQMPLYNQFHLDEPWDSPNNRPLLERMPQTLLCPSRTNVDPGTTTYLRFVGDGALFQNDRATRVADVTDGTSNTLMVVEAEEPVLWSKPEDLPFDPQAVPPFGAGSPHPGGFNAAMADGAVRFIKDTINSLMLKALITRAGGEVISFDQF